MNLKDIRRLADLAHGRQCYGKYSYLVHLEEVRDVLKRFGLSESEDRVHHVSAYLHDLFEDTDFTPNKAAELGIDEWAIEMAFAVTDGAGATRKERKAHAYDKIKRNPGSLTLKLADRIANVESGGKFEMYRKEHNEFREALFDPKEKREEVRRMWAYLDTLFGVNQ